MGTRGTEMIAFRLPSCLGGLFLAFLLLFSVNSWGSCTTGYYNGCAGWQYPGDVVSCQNTYGSNCSQWSGVAACNHNVTVNVKSCMSGGYIHITCVDGGTECNASNGSDYVRTHCTENN